MMIADYDVFEMIGSANHGELWKAAPPDRVGHDSDLVVLKTLPCNATDEEYDRVAKELRIFASLEGPELVPLLDAGHQNGRLFYSMPFYPSGSLDDVGPVDEATARRYLAAIANGAHRLHEAGIVHRDIAPRNILIDGDHARLADLGLARSLDPNASITGTGPVGTVEFAEPGLLSGTHRGSRASDIWSLGATLHWAATGEGVVGELPSRGGLLAILQHVFNTPPMISERLPDTLRPVVERCLSAEPAQRYPSARALAQDLQGMPTR